jgi:hypothetical protein
MSRPKIKNHVPRSARTLPSYGGFHTGRNAWLEPGKPFEKVDDAESRLRLAEFCFLRHPAYERVAGDRIKNIFLGIITLQCACVVTWFWSQDYLSRFREAMKPSWLS